MVLALIGIGLAVLGPDATADVVSRESYRFDYSCIRMLTQCSSTDTLKDLCSNMVTYPYIVSTLRGMGKGFALGCPGSSLQ